MPYTEGGKCRLCKEKKENSLYYKLLSNVRVEDMNHR